MMEAKIGLLIENETPVRIGNIPVYRDLASGYLGFPPPSNSELEAYYNSKYSEDPSKRYNIDSHYENQDLLNERLRLLLSLSSRYLGRRLETSVELGCAFGAMVHQLSNSGVNSAGFDINSEAINSGKRKNPLSNLQTATNRSSLNSLTGQEDLVYTFHTLEHDPELFHFFNDLRSFLGDETMFFFTVPNAMFFPSLLKGFYAHYWAGYPDHLHLISPGFIPYLCSLSGTLPLWWNSTNALNLDPNGFRHMCQLLNYSGPYQSLDALTTVSGQGLELSVLLIKEGSSIARRFNKEISECLNQLNFFRSQEISAFAVLCRRINQEP